MLSSHEAHSCFLWAIFQPGRTGSVALEELFKPVSGLRAVGRGTSPGSPTTSIHRDQSCSRMCGMQRVGLYRDKAGIPQGNFTGPQGQESPGGLD